MKIQFLLFVLFGVFHIHTFAQTNVFYVDHSAVGEDGLNEEAFTQLRERLDAIPESQYILLFVSNGNTPIVGTRKADVSGIINEMYTHTMQLADFGSDMKLLREILYEDVKKLTGKLRFTFFLSDRNTKNIYIVNQSSLLKNLPKEIAAITNSTEPVEVNIFYTNSSKKIVESELKKSLNFYNTPACPPLIAYKISDL